MLCIGSTSSPYSAVSRGGGLKVSVVVCIRGRTTIGTPSTSTSTYTSSHIRVLEILYLQLYFHPVLVLVLEKKYVYFIRTLAQKHAATFCTNILLTISNTNYYQK